jgi:hypothetical protein
VSANFHMAGQHGMENSIVVDFKEIEWECVD